MLSDAVFATFLQRTVVESMDAAGESDILTLVPLPPLPPATYRCEFSVRYLRRIGAGLVEPAPGPVVAALHFPQDYLRSVDAHLGVRVVSLVTPDVVHPNVRGAAVCLGAGFAPGTPIRTLLWELYEILTYRNVTLDERNALDPEACRLLRARPELLAQLGDAPPLRRARRHPQMTVDAR